MGITWEFGDGREAPYTVAIAVSLEPYDAAPAARSGATSSAGSAASRVTMMIVIGGMLTFLLLPLRRLERQVREVEAGERVSLTGRYPSELVRARGEPQRADRDGAPAARALPAHARRSRAQLEDAARRDAHAARGAPAARAPTRGARKARRRLDALNRELERMDQRVSYQLRRARASGSTGLGTEPVAVAPVVEDLKLTLDKVYRDKRVRVHARARARRRVPRRSRRPHRDPRQRDGQRVQVLQEPRARRRALDARAARAARRRRRRRHLARARRDARRARQARRRIRAGAGHRSRGGPRRPWSSIAARSRPGARSSAAPRFGSSSRARARCERGGGERGGATALRVATRAPRDALTRCDAQLSRHAADRGREGRDPRGAREASRDRRVRRHGQRQDHAAAEDLPRGGPRHRTA